MVDPISNEVIMGSMELLTPFERQEVTNYKNVYFLGLNAEKVSPPDCTGFDDSLGFYIAVPNDHINYQYEILSSINKGTFSEVILAYDHKFKRNVAIKISKNTEQNRLIFYEETHKLYVLNEYFEDENTIVMYDYFFFREHPCIVLEVLLNDLDVELKKQNYEGFPLPILREILVSIIEGLKNFSKIKLVHCDLRPANLAFVQEGQYKVKILDLGSSVFVNEGHLALHQCQVHCSPEMIFNTKFGLPSDMWSLGCLAIKLFTGRSPFKANSDKEHLENITKAIGPPTELRTSSKFANIMLESNGNPEHSLNAYSDAEKRKVLTCDIKRFPNAVDLTEMLAKSKSPLFIDFVRRCLQWEPIKRMTPDEASDHPWIKNTSELES